MITVIAAAAISAVTGDICSNSARVPSTIQTGRTKRAVLRVNRPAETELRSMNVVIPMRGKNQYNIYSRDMGAKLEQNDGVLMTDTP